MANTENFNEQMANLQQEFADYQAQAKEYEETLLYTKSRFLQLGKVFLLMLVWNIQEFWLIFLIGRLSAQVLIFGLHMFLFFF